MRHGFALLLMPSLFGVLLGCGSSGPPRVVVTGKVLYKGETVPTGTVVFAGEGNTIESGTIVDGEYKIERAPVGPVQIGVSTPNISAAAEKIQQKQKVEGKSFSGSGKHVSVPDNYREPGRSGLTYTVTSEVPQTHDIIIQK